ncbi:mRNA export factor GLE1 [Exophiala dermatitidis]
MAQARLHSSPLQARSSPRGRRNDDSPSRQIQFELERAFSQIHLHEVERQKLHVYQRRQQQEELDAKELAQAEVHLAELKVANAKHDGVRQQAEAVLHAYIKQQEEEERRRREEERKRLEEEERRKQQEELARKRAEEERKAMEEKERREREEQAKAEAERQAELGKKKAEAEERRRRENEAAERKQREEQLKAEQEAVLRKQEAEKQAAAAAASTQATAPTSQSTSQSPATSPDLEALHRNYLAIHKKLKEFRKGFWEQVKKDPNLKPHVGDMRRAMRTSVGQLTDDKIGNKKAHERVKTTLLRSLTEIPSPPVSVNDYLPSPFSLHDDGRTTVPSLVLYLLSFFSKAIINAFVGECAVNPKAAEPIGTLVAQIFSMPELQFARNVPSNNGRPTTVSLISVLMCKFHATAPILFGIYGPESTSAGRMRLGWRLEKLNDDQKAFVNENKQYDRLTGLGVGYASIALRNFAKAKVQNPWPPTNYWSSLAHIVNTPPDQVQMSHLIVLKSMLEHNAIDRFLLFFGAAGIAALRQAVVDFPRSLPRELQEKPVAKALGLMVEAWKKEKHFSLD